MADIQLEGHQVEWVNQPCGEAGSFTTTGVGRSNQQADSPTMEERLAAFNKAKDQASFWATMFCATNPECPNARFVKYVNVKEDSVKGLLVLELTIQWRCKKEESGNSIPTERA